VQLCIECIAAKQPSLKLKIQPKKLGNNVPIAFLLTA
jgi:hypothetical protein